MKLTRLFATVSIAALAGATLLSAVPASGTRYVILASNAFPGKLAAQVSAAGGVLEKTFPFGVAIASSDNPNFAGKIKGVGAVVEDTGFDVVAPAAQVAVADGFGFPPSSGDDDVFFDLQWGHNYVGAQNAWNHGHFGQGVRVAVLDGGFDLDHPDLAPNIDLIASKDMTGEGLQYGPSGPFSHGSHVAGTIAAADNGFGTIGIAPQATLVLVKVIGDLGSGSFADIIDGIYYATTQNIQVMNMSFGVIFPRGGRDAAAISALAVAVNKAITYATQNGASVFVSAGNGPLDLDGDGSNVRFETGMSHAIGVSALAPQNWATDPNQELAPATYTNYGTSMVDFSAPGGDASYPGNESCTVAGLTRPCWLFDLVFSTGNSSYYWSGGTSMATPHAAGVAALIISETGDANPAHVAAEMRNRAIDLGKAGRDDFFGHGLVNTGN